MSRLISGEVLPTTQACLESYAFCTLKRYFSCLYSVVSQVNTSYLNFPVSSFHRVTGQLAHFGRAPQQETESRDRVKRKSSRKDVGQEQSTQLPTGGKQIM